MIITISRSLQTAGLSGVPGDNTDTSVSASTSWGNAKKILNVEVSTESVRPPR